MRAWYSIAALPAALFLMTACEDKGDDDTGADECTVSLVTAGTVPAADATGVIFLTPTEAQFSADESSATYTLTDGDGNAVSGDTDFNTAGTILTFTPDAALEPSTTYTVDIEWSCNSTSYTFTTSDVGGAVAAPADLVGNVYNIDLSTARVTEPAGVGAIIQPLLEQNPIALLVTPTSFANDELEMLGALGDTEQDPVEQDECAASIDFPTAADFSDNPIFDLGGENLTLSVGGVDIVLDTIDITGVFAADGSSIPYLELSGSADTRAFASLIGEDAEDDAVCELIGSLGLSCLDCDGDTSTTDDVFCLNLVADSIVAEQVDGLDGLKTITQEDVDANDDCATEE